MSTEVSVHYPNVYDVISRNDFNYLSPPIFINNINRDLAIQFHYLLFNVYIYTDKEFVLTVKKINISFNYFTNYLVLI